MQLRCGGMFNNNTTATCPQNVPVKKFWKSVNIWRRYGQSQSRTFFLRHSVDKPVGDEAASCNAEWYLASSVDSCAINCCARVFSLVQRDRQRETQYQGFYRSGKTRRSQGICVVIERSEKNIIFEKSGKMISDCRLQISVIFCVSKY